MGKTINMTFSSSLTNLCEVNSSFDVGILRIAYAGENRNKSFISKEAFARSIKTIYNCPIVCNYDRSTNTLGGHDIEVVESADGELKIVNATSPVGVIPESAGTWWDYVKEEDGTEREYLFAEALLWKRQEAYQKIKEDGITAQSMEITVKDGSMVDGYYHIDDFEFTAFALIGREPCFESASIEVFSKEAIEEFKAQLSEMMHDLEGTIYSVDSAEADEDKVHPLKNTTLKSTMEGGEAVLEEKKSLLEKYGIKEDSLDFSIDDYSVEELVEKFEAMTSDKTEDKDPQEEVATEDEPVEPVSYELTREKTMELIRVLVENSPKIEADWGSYPLYSYEDCDFDVGEVYVWDSNDWLLYGLKFAPNGDSFDIDFESKSRKKYAIVDFDEGDQPSPFISVFNELKNKVSEGKEVSEKYQAATETIQSMSDELDSLRQFKAETEMKIAKDERDNVFSKFEDLNGIEAFAELREHAMEYSLEEIEEKCYALRGKYNTSAKFTYAESKAPKIVVEKSAPDDEPYGGIMSKYGIEANE